MNECRKFIPTLELLQESPILVMILEYVFNTGIQYFVWVLQHTLIVILGHHTWENGVIGLAAIDMILFANQQCKISIEFSTLLCLYFARLLKYIILILI